MRVWEAGPRTLLSLALGLFVISSCTDEEIVFRDRPLFEEPPAAAQSFLGYSDSVASLTVCGNCHVGMQGDWEETDHADAWNGLQSSGAAQPFCEGCHTVSALGNPTEGEVGYTAAPDPRYHDVQCESCHGPGLDHVTNPDATQPTAIASVGLDLTTGCGECHQDTHHPFVEEWEQSKHAGVVGFAAARPECASCHRGQGALLAFGEDAEYVEKDSPEHMPINCVVCHDPHGSDNEHQLRFPVNTPDVNQHLCAQCHNRRTSPDPNSSHGLEPHAPETGLLQGDVGWFPPGSNIDQRVIVATHGSEANEGLCATCHVNSFEVDDAETGEFLFNATGHLFSAIPCLDAQGLPTNEDCILSSDTRSFDGCSASGCHGSPQSAFSALFAASTRIEELAEELIGLLAQVDANLNDPGGEIDATNPTFTVAEGAFFNWALSEFPGGERPDPLLLYAGSTTHNPFLLEALLIASINVVEDEYGVSPSSSLVLTPILPGTD